MLVASTGVALGSASVLLSTSPSPHEALLVFALLSALLSALADTTELRGWAQSASRAAPSAVMYVTAGFGLVALARDLSSLAASVDGVDFYYFVCSARDLAFFSGSLDHFYFPGSFRAWQLAFELGLSDLADLRFWYLGCVLINAALIALIVWRICDSLPMGALSALAYVASGTRLDLLEGIVEPFATVPVLLGVLALSFVGNSRRSSSVGLLMLGAGLGSGLFVKQQAVLLFSGILVLGPRGWSDASSLPMEIAAAGRRIAISLCAAVLTFGVLVMALGDGLTSIRDGLHTLLTYAHTPQSAGLAFVALWTRLPSMSLATAIAVLVVLAHCSVKRLRRAVPAHRLQMTALALVCGISPLLQFIARPYLHYALLSLPFCIIGVFGCVRLTVDVASRRPVIKKYSKTLTFALAMLLLLPNREHRSFWDLAWPGLNDRFEIAPAWSDQPEVASAIESIPTWVKPGEALLVLPPRRNAVFFLSGTTSFDHRYSWAGSGDKLRRAVRERRVRGVLVIDSPLDDNDRSNCETMNCQAVVDLLPEYGYARVDLGGAIVLWFRWPPDLAGSAALDSPASGR